MLASIGSTAQAISFEESVIFNQAANEVSSTEAKQAEDDKCYSHMNSLHHASHQCGLNWSIKHSA